VWQGATDLFPFDAFTWKGLLGRLGAAAIMIAVVSAPHVADGQSSEKTAAENAASGFLGRFDNGDLASIYTSRMSQSFRAINPQQQFIQQGGIMRIQAGGPAEARVLIGSQGLNQMPNGAQGSFFYVRYKVKYPNGFVFQDVTLEKVEGQWLVGYFTWSPAP
jgi:hypothetical protein